MLAWVVMNRQHLPRPARGTRLARTLCSIRALPLPALLFNVPTCKPLDVLTSPILPRPHSHFGSHLTPVPRKSAPFFSYTYVEPIFQPLCFQIHACDGGVPKLPTFEASNVATCFRAIPSLFIPLRTLLQIFALPENSTLFFSSDSALLAKNHLGYGERHVLTSPSSSLWPPCLRVKLSDCVNGACPDPVGALIPILSFDLQLLTFNFEPPQSCFKSFICNTYGPPRKCCKQKTYGPAKLFRCNTYKKPGGGGREAIR